MYCARWSKAAAARAGEEALAAERCSIAGVHTFEGWLGDRSADFARSLLNYETFGSLRNGPFLV